jgi:hypothetical protein
MEVALVTGLTEHTQLVSAGNQEPSVLSLPCLDQPLPGHTVLSLLSTQLKRRLLQSKSHITTDGQSGSRPVCLGVRTPSGRNYLILYILQKVKVTLRLMVRQSVSQSISQSVSWCRVPSGIHDQMFVSVWKLLICPCGAPPLRKWCVCHLSVAVCIRKSVVSVYTIMHLHFTCYYMIYLLVKSCIYNIYKVSFIPDSLQQIMPYQK